MEGLEKHILHKLLEGENISINQEQLSYFSLEFYKQYTLIKKMQVQNLPINKLNLETYALLQEQTINTDYIEKNEAYSKGNINDIIKVQVQIKETQKKMDQMNRLVERLKKGDLTAGIELQSVLSKTINKTQKGEVVKLGEYYREQELFFERLVTKETMEGLILWGHNKKNTKQFMGLSNILKRIALTDLTIIGARPSVGKTSFALALMNALYKNDYKPLFISLEMTNGELLQRLATAKSGLSYDLMVSPETDLTADQIYEYTKALKEASEMDISLVKNPPTSWLEMKQLILNHKDEIDYVIIDHMHIITSYDGTNNQNKNQMYGEISRDMKLFARDHEIPIIVLSQLSREVRNQRTGKNRVDPTYVEPYETDLRDSGSLEQDADKVLLLYRDNPKMSHNHELYGKFPIICKVAKHRSGKLGKVYYWFNAKTGRWEEDYKKEVNEN